MNPKRRTSRRAGFTLLELLVVAGIIAMVAVLSIPSIGSTMKGRRLRAAESSIRGSLLTARSAAIARRSVYGVEFAIAARKIYIQDLSGRTLEKAIDLPDLVDFDTDASRTTAVDASDAGGSDLPEGYADDTDTLPDIWFGPDGTVLDTRGWQVGIKERNAVSPVATPEKFRQIKVNRWTGMTKSLQP